MLDATTKATNYSLTGLVTQLHRKDIESDTGVRGMFSSKMAITAPRLRGPLEALVMKPVRALGA
ncbi:MAG TPA: hypothetical protein VK074_00995, partial [Fodinibius sp.]|nr:hypothetical protein [Fodinibius sp.]